MTSRFPKWISLRAWDHRVYFAQHLAFNRFLCLSEIVDICLFVSSLFICFEWKRALFRSTSYFMPLVSHQISHPSMYGQVFLKCHVVAVVASEYDVSVCVCFVQAPGGSHCRRQVPAQPAGAHLADTHTQTPAPTSQTPPLCVCALRLIVNWTLM